MTLEVMNDQNHHVPKVKFGFLDIQPFGETVLKAAELFLPKNGLTLQSQNGSQKRIYH